MVAGQMVAVYGAYGHTGRFVVAELLERGFVPVLSGRDADKLKAVAMDGSDVRPAPVDDPAALDRALAGAAAVINCAGPFATTAAPLVEAALRAGIPYVDVAGEVEATLDTFAHFADRARATGAVVLPAMAFFGGLGDLLATAALGDWEKADEAHIAYALDSWHPTPATRASGAVSRARRGGRRLRFADGRMEYRDDSAPTLDWVFPDPLGSRTVYGEFLTADVVTAPTHLPVAELSTYMTVDAIKDVLTPDSPAPAAVDERGRSAQTFLVDVVVRSDGRERRAVARGRDIYAVSAPLAVEAVHRILAGRTRTLGVASAGALFDAADFLRTLSPHISVELSERPRM
ncbi:saccharopine dehydrogenase family protein [Streptomyces melanogenes]|uniref:saccharopine dehydrogenase family protein n=1 Tax=Streptomyces melanogenes TaxID=67326 RepID=UPI00167E7656|nr:NAD(P)H-binding protein [Streptomyces melanogenes]GGP33462.1 saccharopine dehydrogenase [Streptomyces melanogenes]